MYQKISTALLLLAAMCNVETRSYRSSLSIFTAGLQLRVFVTLHTISRSKCIFHIHCVSKNADVAHYNFDAYQPILVVIGRGVVERLRYRKMICFSTSHNVCTLPGETQTQKCKNCAFQMQCQWFSGVEPLAAWFLQYCGLASCNPYWWCCMTL